MHTVSPENIAHRVGVGVRHAGDDGSLPSVFRDWATTNKGTLLGVYDVRYNSSVDLQEHVDVGLSRSVDGGKTWEKMRLPLAFGETGGLPAAQNGVGDPSILVDTKTNTTWVVAAWTHGMGNQRAWWSSYPGNGYDHTARWYCQRVRTMVKRGRSLLISTDQVKDPTWYFLFKDRREVSPCKTAHWYSRFSLSILPVFRMRELCIAKTVAKHGKSITMHAPIQQKLR